ncbi:MAG: hypothetical protein EAZ60_27080 [Oscillatoriales cyanobacterium]|nr:MAG: hypothetical protein EAZ83_23435 [Oscillatoriales cyanobacterium]TAE95628.1 MAG: hypothetical protein EAZ79_18090 [Oscillatoriales cyanobacterium]TAF16397.1 MAG: hypothetical protein EAZ73_24785 [Oscillatoriales cyanobacterium]TAF29671.1 MAG: hypothetical protein EAZ69_24535 [Oscillatoriales cyanobacterium]TAF51050.1 MAG: hypothetical protein EAZ60_27080 [Oscillatoriales cyanobacterium]
MLGIADRTVPAKLLAQAAFSNRARSAPRALPVNGRSGLTRYFVKADRPQLLPVSEPLLDAASGLFAKISSEARCFGFLPQQEPKSKCLLTKKMVFLMLPPHPVRIIKPQAS